MSEDEKNIIADTLRSPGWKLLERWNNDQIDHYRILATQSPEALTDAQRTWFSALARGRKEVFDGAVDIISSLQTENVV